MGLTSVLSRDAVTEPSVLCRSADYHLRDCRIAGGKQGGFSLDLASTYTDFDHEVTIVGGYEGTFSLGLGVIGIR
jgi:hypothetical protein